MPFIIIVFLVRIGDPRADDKIGICLIDLLVKVCLVVRIGDSRASSNIKLLYLS